MQDIINRINKNFYNKQYKNFSKTRVSPWKGWETLLPYIKNMKKQKKDIKILDLGCGNARFLSFLVKRNIDIEYEGWDFSSKLIKEAKKINKHDTKARFKIIDITKKIEINDKYDIITLFGVSHHLEKKYLNKLLSKIQNRLNINGLLFISFWQIYKNKDKFNKLKYKKLKGNSIFLLKWQNSKDLRTYIKYTEKDIVNLVKKLKSLKIERVFENEGKERNLNYYLILKKLK